MNGEFPPSPFPSPSPSCLALCFSVQIGEELKSGEVLSSEGAGENCASSKELGNSAREDVKCEERDE